METVSSHFHKEDRISEKDIIPDGDTVSVVPTWSASEGTEVSYLSGSTFRRYKMISGTWRVIGDLPPTAATLIPQANFPVTITFTSASLSSNTNEILGQVVVPVQITVNKVSFVCSTVTAAGTAKIAMYSEDGQSKLFEETTATISGAGVITTALSAAVTLSPGVYYFAILPVSTTNVTVLVYTRNNNLSVDALRTGVTSEPILEGNLTVTADTPASTFDPVAGITAGASRVTVIRLDN